jgi:N-acetylglucosamine-6-phosphate deacetylase
MNLPWISPGWIDLQVNGFEGFDFNDPEVSEKDVIGITQALHKVGVTHYFPTVITGDERRIRHALSVIAAAYRRHPSIRESVAGIHLEGPYLSPEDGPRGAHAKEHIRKPSWEEFLRFQEAANGLIKLVTIAPESEGAIPFIEKLVARDITVAIGHTNANEEQLRQAVHAGASMSTHLGNGAHPRLARHPNYIWSQLADDRLWATFIPDGHHLAPSVMKAMLRAKRDKAILVSDCVKFAGLPAGRYTSEIGHEVELREDGKLFPVSNPDILAGSAFPLNKGVAGAIRYTDMDLREAVEAVTLRPAQVMRLSELGRLDIGRPAHFTLFDYDEGQQTITIRETVVQGETVFCITP